jgi:transposase
MAVQVVGLDTAKHVFQVHGADASGRAVLKKRLRRAQIPDFFANLPKCVVGIEATQGAHYWSRVIGAFGHEVRLVAPQFVKPYLKGQKNDARDAAAICEAISRPEMHFVPRKSIEQQDLQALHRIRSRLVGTIHGARSVVFRAGGKTDRRSQWIADKQRRLGTTKACVAVANKNARIIWALLAKNESYRVAA